ncbi:MAG TPA: hypothetical protein VFJ16_19900 [Longimicrobium sp.]|nr:hypothetical protein [Longimicrobium sp.]
MAQLIIFVRLRPLRTDLQPHQHAGEGQSRFWQVNAFDPANHTPAGRKLLRLMGAFQGLWLAAILLLAGFFMGLL